MTSADSDRVRTVKAYHERTKHDFYRYAQGPYDLDWASQPDPFRRWKGAQLFALEVDGDLGQPDWAAAKSGDIPPAKLNHQSLSRFLFDSLALSAWKEAGGARWSLRVNPSSGNLHPTEAHLLLPAMDKLAETCGVYHYAPRQHELELRAALSETNAELLGDLASGCEFFVGLTSILWRESWKYGERAFRYTQHDAGHAIAALSIAAAGLGWRAALVDELSSEDLALWLGCAQTSFPESEEADVLVRVSTGQEQVQELSNPCVPGDSIDWIGEPSVLSPSHVHWDVIEAVAAAAKKPRGCDSYEGAAEQHPPDPSKRPKASLRQLVRKRRSAVAMDGCTTLSSAGFFQMLADCVPQGDAAPFSAIRWRPRLHLALFVHRVDGVAPGLYWLSRESSALQRAKQACSSEFRWERPPALEDELPLYLLKEGPVAGLAARLSCQQEIAGSGAFSLGMIADFDDALDSHGAWFYPRLFWEAGLIGQALYLEAHVHGLSGTGIGCYFDNPVHAALGLMGSAWQSLYHFTVGGAVDDARLQTLPAYESSKGSRI